MRKNIMQDERIIISKRKIQSDGFQIVWLVLLVSVLVQQYLFNAPFTQYAVEFFIFIAMSIYVLIANIVTGNDLFTSKRRGHITIMINSLVAGAIVAMINTAINYMNYNDKIQHPVVLHIALVAGIIFISTTLLAFVVLEIFYSINNKKQQSIDKKLNAEDICE